MLYCIICQKPNYDFVFLGLVFNTNYFLGIKYYAME